MWPKWTISMYFVDWTKRQWGGGPLPMGQLQPHYDLQQLVWTSTWRQRQEKLCRYAGGRGMEWSRVSVWQLIRLWDGLMWRRHFFSLSKTLVYTCNNSFVCEMVWRPGITFIMFHSGNEIITDMTMRDRLYILSD